MKQEQEPKLIFWMGSSRSDLKGMPESVRRTVGHALWWAQLGEKHPDAKPMRGFGGAGVLEVVEDVNRSTYRAVYTVRFAGAVYGLHVFQKKSKQAIKTPAGEMDLIRKRLKQAEQHYAKWRTSQKEKTNEG